MVAYYHNLFTPKEDVKTVCEECKAGKRGCVACKKQLAKNIIEELRPIREKEHITKHIRKKLIKF